MEIVSPIPAGGPRVPNARLGLLMTGLIIAALALLGMRGIDWFLLKKSLQNRFPKIELFSVKTIGTSWDEIQKRFFAEGALFDSIYTAKGVAK